MAKEKYYQQLKIISRNSPLAIKQVEEIFRYFPNIKYELIKISSYGDKNKNIYLTKNIPSDFFTRELDDAIINGIADISIHSAKDLPYPLPKELELIALFEAFDKTDSLVNRYNVTLENLPKGARIGTSSVTRQEEIIKIRPDLKIVSIRGTIEERLEKIKNNEIDALIVATCALKRLGLDNLISEILEFQTHDLQGKLAVISKKDNKSVKDLFKDKDIRSKYGKVTLVGFGPGNPSLLTIAGDKAIRNADVIFYDDLIDKEFLKDLKSEKIYVGKRRNNHSHTQEEINELLYKSAIAGNNVVRVKGGDAMIFAHGREEIDFLNMRFVDVDVIPGISTGIALSSYTRIPLTHRGISSSIAFVTGNSLKDNFVPNCQTLVYYMAGANIPYIAANLIDNGWSKSTAVSLVYNVSLDDQKIFYSTLIDLKDSKFKYPTPIIIIIGDVVNFEITDKYKPSVLITGTTKEEYDHLGNIIHTPLIKICKIEENELLKKELNSIDKYDWIIFTSRYGVKYFFEGLFDFNIDIRNLHNINIASVGNTTSAELKKYNIYPNIQSETESAEGLIKYFKEKNISNNKILLPRSNKGLKYIYEELLKLCNNVLDVPVYTNELNKNVKTVDLKTIKTIVFSSPSTIDAFLEIYGYIPNDVDIVTKGKTTKEYLNNKK